MALWAWCVRQATEMRQTWLEVHRQYQIEYARLQREDLERRSPEDQVILAAIDRAQQDQRDRVVEMRVRRLHEASRFVSRPPTDRT